MDEVFFFPEFRTDDDTSEASRKKNWAAKVAKLVAIPGSVSKKDLPLDITRFDIPQERSIANEVYSYQYVSNVSLVTLQTLTTKPALPMRSQDPPVVSERDQKQIGVS